MQGKTQLERTNSSLFILQLPLTPSCQCGASCLDLSHEAKPPTNMLCPLPLVTDQRIMSPHPVGRWKLRQLLSHVSADPQRRLLETADWMLIQRNLTRP